MRRAAGALALAVAAVAAAGCGDEWPALDPVDRPGELDPRLGVELDRAASSFRIASTYGRDGVTVVYEVANVGWHALRVTPDGAITRLPTPDVRPGETVTLSRTFDPDGAVLVLARDDELVVQTLIGDQWRTLPAPPTAFSGDADLSAVFGHHGRIYLGAFLQLYVWNGTAWTQPLANDTLMAFHLGGYDAQTQWVFRWMPATAWQAIPLDNAGGAGAAVPFGGGVPVNGVNGDATQFQVVDDQRLWQFAGGAFTAGDLVIGTTYTAPGQSRIVLGGPRGPLVYAQGGAAAGQAMPSVQPYLDCTCSVASDPSCGCIEHEVDFVSLIVAPTVDRAAFVMADNHQGEAVLAARFVALPTTVDPFAR